MFAETLKAKAESLNKPNGRGGQQALAKLLNTHSGNISRWIDGAAIEFGVAAEILHKLGGDIEKAMPDYDDARWEEEITVHGQVAAGGLSMGGDATSSRSLKEGLVEVWKKNPLWGMTHGAVINIEVCGDSMAPEFEDGEIVICRKPTNPQHLRDGSYVFFQLEDGEQTFKMLRWDKDGFPLGVPVNPQYDYISFKDRAYTIPYVVVGKIDIAFPVSRAVGFL